jgi:hypothetical protein
VFFSELAATFRAVQAGTETYAARLVVGHDGSMIRLASGLGLGAHASLRWPALGSEIVLEVRRRSSPACRACTDHSGGVTRYGAQRRATDSYACCTRALSSTHWRGSRWMHSLLNLRHSSRRTSSQSVTRRMCCGVRVD